MEKKNILFFHVLGKLKTFVYLGNLNKSFILWYSCTTGGRMDISY